MISGHLDGRARAQTTAYFLIMGAVLLSFVGTRAVQAEDPSRQLSSLSGAYQRTPSDKTAAKKYGFALLDAGKATEACKVFEALADKMPTDGESRYLFGEALFADKKFVDASIELKRAGNLDSTKPEYVVRAGEALLAAKRFDDLTELTTNALAKGDQSTKRSLEWLQKMAKDRVTEKKYIVPKALP